MNSEKLIGKRLFRNLVTEKELYHEKVRVWCRCWWNNC